MSRTGSDVPASDWLICLGAQRDIRDRRVTCPLQAGTANLAACLACRHLEWVVEDRGTGPACAIEEPGPVAVEVS